MLGWVAGVEGRVTIAQVVAVGCCELEDQCMEQAVEGLEGDLVVDA